MSVSVYWSVAWLEQIAMVSRQTWYVYGTGLVLPMVSV
jgi:hypothetical protein